MSNSSGPGRVGNQFIRHVSASIFAEKFNLDIKYYNIDGIEKLGIPLFQGDIKYDKSSGLSSNNYMDTYQLEKIDFNVDTSDFLQSQAITTLINEHLNSNVIMNAVMEKNSFKHRYQNNNDCFIHIRLGDVEKFNPGFEYYDNILSKLQFDNLYVATDTPNHQIITALKTKYVDLQMYGGNVYDTILFGSTCKNVILSYGTFSSVIGYLSYYSTVYHVPYCEKYAWDWGRNCDTQSGKTTKIGSWVPGQCNI